MKKISNIMLCLMLVFTLVSNLKSQSKDEFQRCVFIEQFTSEGCVYCPASTQLIEQAIRENNASKRVVWVCHHDGFSKDWLTVPASSMMLWFYGDGSKYAPAMMWDRKSISNALPVMAVPDFVHEIINIMDSRLAEPAAVSVSLFGSTFDATTRELSIKVSGQFGETIYGGNIMLNVYLVEDNILARNQLGGVPTPTSWVHNNVLRFVVTPEWGDHLEVSKEGDRFEKTFTTIIPDTYSDVNVNIDHFKIVAFVSRYDATDVNNCEVFNATQLFINDLLSTVELSAVSIYGLQDVEYKLEGAATYVTGEEATIKATATQNGVPLQFIYWADVEGTELSIDNPYKFDVVENSTIYAYFGKPQTGVDSFYTSPVNVYPNPVKDILNIKGDYKLIEIYNGVGCLVTSYELQFDGTDITQINVSGWPDGVYIIKIFSDGAISRHKIIK